MGVGRSADDDTLRAGVRRASSANTPDARGGAVCVAPRPLAGVWIRSAVADADRAHGADPRRGPPVGGRDPPAWRRVGHRVYEGPACRPWMGGRGAGRDVVSLVTWRSPWLSEATNSVELRSPVDRRPVACGGDRSAWPRRPPGRTTLGSDRRCAAIPFSLALPFVRTAPAVRPPSSEIFQKAGPPQRAPLCLYNRAL